MYKNYFTETANHALKNYSYHPGAYTPFDRLCTHWWNFCLDWFVPKVPL